MSIITSSYTVYVLHLQVVYALVPLAELLGYSKHLRIITSGHSTFTMELHSYKEVNGQDERDAIKNITGFYPS